jgi:hypothetical protein
MTNSHASLVSILTITAGFSSSDFAKTAIVKHLACHPDEGRLFEPDT